MFTITAFFIQYLPLSALAATWAGYKKTPVQKATGV
jgi:hypothetical protein